MKKNKILLLVGILMHVCSMTYAQNVDIEDSIKAVKIVDWRKISSTTLTKVSRTDLKPVIAPLGEVNAIGFVKMLPGISSGVEGSNSFYVRGGNNGNNLISVDGVTLYGNGHLLGFTSAISNSMVEKSEFYKGGFLSEDGNFLASHLKFTMKEGDMKEVHGGAGISNVMFNGWISTPIIKDTLSVIINVRYSPIEAEYNMFSSHWKENEFLPEKINASVYDIYGKVKYIVDKRNTVTLTSLYTYDDYGYNFKDKSDDNFAWRNMIVAGNWIYLVNPQWELNTHLSFNHFQARQYQQRLYSSETKDATDLGIVSRINELKLSSLAKHPLDEYSNIQFGVESRIADFCPGTFKNFKGNTTGTEGNPNIRTFMLSLHGQYEFKKGKFLLRDAVRLNYFSDGETDNINAEFRIYADYKIKSYWGVELTADHLVQYYHTLEGIPTGFSTDIIVPSGYYAKPEMSSQIYTGTYAQIGESFTFSVGGFYKYMQNLVFFKNASELFGSSYAGWKDNLDIGKGKSYGVEFSAEKSGERLTLKAAYTLSKTDRTYPNINYGRPIPFKFDRTHILNMSGIYDFVKNDKYTHSFSVNFTYNTGHCESLLTGFYLTDIIPGLGDVQLDYHGRPNNHRVPDYIRLDAGYTLSVKGERVNHNLSIGCFNVLNRHNTYTLFWDSDDQVWKQVSVMPIMPNINYSIEF